MNPNQNTSRAVIRINGKEIEFKPGAKFERGGEKRNTTKGMNRVGFSSELTETTLSGARLADGATDLDADMNLSDVTVDVTVDTGQRWIMAHAWLMEAPSLTFQDGGGDTYTFVCDPANCKKAN